MARFILMRILMAAPTLLTASIIADIYGISNRRAQRFAIA